MTHERAQNDVGLPIRVSFALRLSCFLLVVLVKSEIALRNAPEMPLSVLCLDGLAFLVAYWIGQLYVRRAKDAGIQVSRWRHLNVLMIAAVLMLAFDLSTRIWGGR